MCAGRCREPRRKGTRVADLSGCIVPWAARASCWPQPQQLLPVSAAGSGRRCCTGAFLPAGLFGGSMLFESTLAAPFARQIKQKLRYPLDTGVLGGRGWIARAAHLKKPRRGFFTRRTIRRVDAVRIHPCSPFCKTDKTETPVPGSDTGVLGGRGWIARAALLKTAHWAVFAPSSAPSPQLFESTRSMSLALLQNKNLSVFAYVEVFWWARVDSNHRS